MKRQLLMMLASTALLAGGPAFAGEIGDYASVTKERLVNPEPQNWLQTRRTYDGQGHSPLKEITPENIGGLQEVWTSPTGPYAKLSDFVALPARGAHQAPPIVNDGVMFMTTYDNQIIALDAKTGEEYWRYQYSLPEGLIPVHPTNRGAALYDDKVFMATLDAHVVAVDAKTGKELWNQKVADWEAGYYMTLSPLVVNGKVMVGPSGGEFGIRGFVEALDAETGKSVWKTFTIPEPGQPGSETWPGDTWKTGGGPVWIQGNYDVESDTAYFGVGNPAPWVGDLRKGDNLYTTSTIGLDPETGKIKTHFQYHWNDTWDWDEVVPPTLIDVKDGDKIEKLAIRFARNGYAYKLNREGGNLSFVEGKPYVYQDVFTGLDPKTGRPSYDPEHVPGLGKFATYCPSAWGGRNWPADSYDPELGLLFLSVNENHCGESEGAEVDYEPGVLYLGAGLTMHVKEGADHIGAVQAWDVKTMEKKWQTNFESPSFGPVLSTAGGLVFVGGTNDSEFRAMDGKTGETVWSKKLDSGVVAPPTSFELDGRQYIAVVTGWGVDAGRFQGFVNADLGTDPDVPKGGTIYVFALPST